MPQNPASDVRDTSPDDVAPEVFGWLCDNALHRFSTRPDGVPHADELSQTEVAWAWQMAWLALDLASAPANNLPERHAQAGNVWPLTLVEALHAESTVPKLPAAAWLELRQARELMLFAKLPARESWPTSVLRPHTAVVRELSAALLKRQFVELAQWATPASLERFKLVLRACLWVAVTKRRGDDLPAEIEPAHALQSVLQFVAAFLQMPRDTPKGPFGGASSALATTKGGVNFASIEEEDEFFAAYLGGPQHNAGSSAEPRSPVPAAVRGGDEVQFTVFRPTQLAPERWSKLLAFAHLAQRRPDAPPGTPDPFAQVQEQARALLGSELPEYRQLSEDAGQPIPFEGQLTFIPEVDDVKFDPPRASVLWVDDVQRVEFRMRPSSRLAGNTARGRLSVFCGSILVAELQLSLRVAASHADASQALAPPESTRMYRKIFASYSHKDTGIVEQFRQLAKAFGDSYLIDVTDLRAGERWSEALEQLIRDADVFQLFWSWSSMRSEFVRREWEYALQLGRPSFVRPTYWEQPMPAVPNEGLPPPQLASLHFHALSLPGESQPPTAANTNAQSQTLGLPLPASVPMRTDGYISPRDDAGIGLDERVIPESTPASRSWLRRVAPISSSVALGAALLFVLNTVHVLGPPSERPPVTIEAPNSTEAPVSKVPIIPAPPTPVISPWQGGPTEPTPDKPAPIRPVKPAPKAGTHVKPSTSTKRPASTSDFRTRFPNVAAAKRAFDTQQIDQAEYGQAIKELEAERVRLRERETVKLKRGAVSKPEYERSLEVIDSDLGFVR